MIELGLTPVQANSRVQQLPRDLTVEHVHRLVRLVKLKMQNEQVANPIGLFIHLARNGAEFGLLERYDEQVRITGVDNYHLIDPGRLRQRAALAALR